MVFSEELECWCRALVESVWCRVDGYQLGCFLVDYAKHCSVPSEKYVLRVFITVMYLLIDRDAINTCLVNALVELRRRLCPQGAANQIIQLTEPECKLVLIF